MTLKQALYLIREEDYDNQLMAIINTYNYINDPVLLDTKIDRLKEILTIYRGYEKTKNNYFDLYNLGSDISKTSGDKNVGSLINKLVNMEPVNVLLSLELVNISEFIISKDSLYKYLLKKYDEYTDFNRDIKIVRSVSSTVTSLWENYNVNENTILDDSDSYVVTLFEYLKVKETLANSVKSYNLSYLDKWVMSFPKYMITPNSNITSLIVITVYYKLLVSNNLSTSFINKQLIEDVFYMDTLCIDTDVKKYYEKYLLSTIDNPFFKELKNLIK